MSETAPDINPVAARREKLRQLLAGGINPYPSEARSRTPLAEVAAYIDEHCPNPGDSADEIFAAAGRIRAIRGQGGIVFIDLEDQSGRLQLVAKEEILSEAMPIIPLLDLGDFIWVEGAVLRTKRGEASLSPHELVLLTKTLRPLPDKRKGLKDPEARQRQRYLDLLMNKEVRQRFEQKSAFAQSFRQALLKNDFLEVETPVLEHVPGGADAEPFVTRHQTLDIDLYLRISLELHLKRVMVGGFEKVFELGRVFRNEGMSPQHLQEFTMLEFYWAYADYEKMMTFVEELYAEVLQQTFSTTVIERDTDTPLDFTPPWPRVKYVEQIRQATGLDILSASDEELLAAVKKHRGEVEAGLGRPRLLDLLYKKTVRPSLTRPQFLIDPPLVLSPLAKPHRDTLDQPAGRQLAERFWVLAAGAEVGNGFSELNDPLDQKKRFLEQEKLREGGDKEAQRLDHDYIRALEYGLPPAAGFGIGLDRLFALVTNQPSIRDAVLFPTMRPKQVKE